VSSSSSSPSSHHNLIIIVAAVAVVVVIVVVVIVVVIIINASFTMNPDNVINLGGWVTLILGRANNVHTKFSSLNTTPAYD